MLLDIWDAKGDERVFPAVTKLLLATRHQAKRFLFSNDVTAQIAALVRDHPNTLLDNLQFALPPYETTYLEFNVHVFLEELGSRTTIDLYPPGTPYDENVGYMIHRGHVVVLSQDSVGNMAPGALTYMLNNDKRTPEGFAEILVRDTILPETLVRNSNVPDNVLDEESFNKLLSLNLGSTIINPKAIITPELADYIVGSVTRWADLNLVSWFDNLTHKSREDYITMVGSTGELRNLWALLMWLNESRVSYTEQIPASRAWYKGKSRAFASHRIVKLRETFKSRYVNRYFPVQTKKAQHDVEAFFRNFNRDDTCQHDWPIMPDDRGHWHCRKCPQWRTRVREHKRGDPSIGVITKEYRT